MKEFVEPTSNSVTPHTHASPQTADFPPSPSSNNFGRESLYKDNIKHKPEDEGVSGNIACSHENWKLLRAFDINK